MEGIGRIARSCCLFCCDNRKAGVFLDATVAGVAVSLRVARQTAFLIGEPRMLTKETITKALREKYPYLAAEFGVKRIGLFGSYAKDAANEDSDIDLVVEFERPIGFKFIELAEYLERLLGRRVDILTPAGIGGIRIPAVARRIEESVLYV